MPIHYSFMRDWTDAEDEKLAAWLAEHDKTCPYYDDGTNVVSPTGAIGGRLTYGFTPTNLGMIIVVKCACGQEINLTDFSNW